MLCTLWTPDFLLGTSTFSAEGEGGDDDDGGDVMAIMMVVVEVEVMRAVTVVVDDGD